MEVYALADPKTNTLGELKERTLSLDTSDFNAKPLLDTLAHSSKHLRHTK